ncbi:hypothetical protein ACFX19_041819 [Malus domestica]
MAKLLHLCSYCVLVLVLYVNLVTSFNQFGVGAPGPAPSGGPTTSPSPAPSPSPSPSPPSPTPPSPESGLPPPPTNSKGSSGGVSGGQKAGVVFGVLIGVGLIWFGGYVYKIRRANIRRGRYGVAARRSYL